MYEFKMYPVLDKHQFSSVCHKHYTLQTEFLPHVAYLDYLYCFVPVVIFLFFCFIQFLIKGCLMRDMCWSAVFTLLNRLQHIRGYMSF